MRNSLGRVEKTRVVKSAFGCHYIKNDWEDTDWDNYQFNLSLRESVYNRATLEGRKINRDERKFINELEDRNQLIRDKYEIQDEGTVQGHASGPGGSDARDLGGGSDELGAGEVKKQEV